MALEGMPRNNIDSAPGVVDEVPYPDEGWPEVRPGFYVNQSVADLVAQLTGRTPHYRAGPAFETMQHTSWWHELVEAFAGLTSAPESIPWETEKSNVEGDGTVVEPSKKLKGGQTLPERRFNSGPPHNPHARGGKGGRKK